MSSIHRRRPSAATGPGRSPGVVLVGEYTQSGSTEVRYLVRRGDGRMITVSPVIHAVLAHLDGRRDHAQVAALATVDLGRTVTADNVAYLVEHKLAPLGLVDDSVPQPAGARPARRRALIPARVVQRAASACWWLFLPPVMAAVVAALVALDAWLLATGGLGVDVAPQVQAPAAMAVLIVVLVASGFFHELGHATAAGYAGATPGGIGVGVFLVWPAFFSEMTDTYRLSRRDRLRADLGGVYFNAVAAVVLGAAYLASGVELLVLLVALQHLLALYQLLPFLGLDGYYIVSDALGVPDLSAQLRPALSRLVGRLTGRSRTGLDSQLRPGVRVALGFWAVIVVGVAVAALVLVVLNRAAVGAYVNDEAMAVARLLRHGDPRGVLAVMRLALLAVPLLALVGLAARAVTGRIERVPRSSLATPPFAGRGAVADRSPDGAPGPDDHHDREAMVLAVAALPDWEPPVSWWAPRARPRPVTTPGLD